MIGDESHAVFDQLIEVLFKRLAGGVAWTGLFARDFFVDCFSFVVSHEVREARRLCKAVQRQDRSVLGCFWSSKFLVLAQVSGWDIDNKKMARLPLFLEGDAFLVFSRMPTADQKDKEKVPALMKFSVSRREAFQCFTQRKLRLDESINAFAVDFRRLLALSGHKDGGEKDAVVIEQILAGIPAHLS